MNFALKCFLCTVIWVQFSWPSVSAQSQTEWIKIYFNMPGEHSAALPGNENRDRYDLMKTLQDRIDSARSSIDLCIYDLEHPQIAHSLIRAKQRGLRVRIITDNHNRTDAGETDLEMWRLLREAGIISMDDDGDVYEADGSISDFDLVNDGSDMHNKFAVIDALSSSPDDDYVWTGSTNLTYTGAFNTNNVLVIKDAEVAGIYREEFEQMWGDDDDTPNPKQARFHKDKKDVSQHIFDVNGTRVEIYFAPVNRDNSKPDVSDRIVEVIQKETQHDINFQAFAITPDIPLSAEMWNRTATGEIELNGVIDNLFYSRYKKTGAIWGTPLAQSGNRMILPSSELRKLHHKIIVLDANHPDTADQGVVITGSYNFSRNANVNNDENLLIIYSDKIANQYYQDFMGVMNRAQKKSYPPAPPVDDIEKWHEVSAISDASRFEIEIMPGFGYGVRLLGLEVPSIYSGADSSDYFSGVAGDYVRNLLEGRRIQISGVNGQIPDVRYNAFQAYVQIDYDGNPVSLNKLLLEKGFARVSNYGIQHPDSITSFKKYEEQARLKKEGFWKAPEKINTRVLRSKELGARGAVTLIYPININTADGATLQLLPGIGPAYSKRIIDYRLENGGFNTVEELTEIKGIGPKTLQKLRPIVTVE